MSDKKRARCDEMIDYDPTHATHPARKASLLSRQYVHGHNKQEWLALFAEEGIIEDPIGVSPQDPTGQGHRGAAREAFWDTNIANTEVTMTIHQSYAAGNEVANHVTLDLILPVQGKRFRLREDAVVTYRVNDAGKILSLRVYFEPEETAKTMREVTV